FSRAAVGYAADRVYRFKGGSGCDDDTFPRQRPGSEQRPHVIEELLRFEHSAHADLAAGLVAACRTEDSHAIALELRDIALSRLVVPHLPVHRRRNDERTVTRDTKRRQQVVRKASGELGEKIGSRRSDHYRIGAT